MKSTRGERISQLCRRAADLRPRQRAAFLEQECGDDASLQAEVQAMLARGPAKAGTGHQLRRFVRNHRGLVAGLLATALALAAGLVGTLVFANRAAVAQMELREAKQALQIAEEERDNEREKLAAVNAFLRRMLDQVQSPQGVGASVDGADLLEALDREAELIDAETSGGPVVAAAVRSTIGDLYFALGEYRKAARHYGVAKDLCWKTNGFDRDSADAMADYGAALARSGSVDEGVGWFMKALAIHRQVSGDDSYDTGLTEVRSAFPLIALDRFDEAEANIRSGVDKLRRHATTATVGEIERAIREAAGAYYVKKRYDRAGALYSDALAVLRETHGGDHPRVLLLVCLEADCRARAGDAASAVSDMRGAFERLRRVRGLEDKDTQRALNTFICYLDDMGLGEQATELRPLLQN